MKIVIQRSKKSSVEVENEIVGSIQQGLVLLICFEKEDLEKKQFELIEKAAQKILALRIFEDENGKMNKSILETGGDILAISQFTLSWNGQKGNRPSFDLSMPPELANKYFNDFIDYLKKHIRVETGVFGANMKVAITNDGPVTFSLSF